MSITKLQSGRLRVQVWDASKGRNVSAAKILGLPRDQSTWPDTRQGRRAAIAAREQARKLLTGEPGEIVTVKEWRTRWLDDPLFARPKRSTMIRNDYNTRAFANDHGQLPLRAVDDALVGRYLRGGKRNHTVGALSAMFSDAASLKAGRLIPRNPFAGLGLAQTRGNRDEQPPTETMVRALIEHAEKQGGPGFRAWLEVACYSGLRPGELDALRWDAIDFDTDTIHVREQYSAHSAEFTLPKNGKPRVAPLTPNARQALLSVPRESEFCFVNLRGRHFTSRGRYHCWKATRAAAGWDGTLYLATRHFAGWHMVNILGLLSEDVAIALGHEDGGQLVRQLYGHRDRDQALNRVREAYRDAAKVVQIDTKRRTA